MIKYFILAALALALAAGWLLAPLALIQTSGTCATESLFIYNEPGQVVTTDSRWFTHGRTSEHYYQATIRKTVTGQAEARTIAHRTAETEASLHADSFTLRTVKAFRLAGPEASDPQWGAYIDPLAKPGFTHRIYAFRTEGGRRMLGYRGLPITTCLKNL